MRVSIVCVLLAFFCGECDRVEAALHPHKLAPNLPKPRGAPWERFPIAYQDLAQKVPGAMLFVDEEERVAELGFRDSAYVNPPMDIQQWNLGICEAGGVRCVDGGELFLPVAKGDDFEPGKPRAVGRGYSIRKVGPALKTGPCVEYVTEGPERFEQTYLICAGTGVARMTVRKAGVVQSDYVLRSRWGLLGYPFDRECEAAGGAYANGLCGPGGNAGPRP
jgi:hypothetical protein